MDNPIFKVTILSIFPQMFPGPLGYSLAGQALKRNIWSCDVIDIKDFGITRHKKVDDEPFGGISGLVMRPDVIGYALDNAIKSSGASQIYYFSPRGKIFSQGMVSDIVQRSNIILLCGRFAGIDERLIEEYQIQEISIGDFVLSGGEIAAFAMIDTLIRFLPGVIKNKESLMDESFGSIQGAKGMLEYPLYTRPRLWKGRSVPDVLLSGDHKKIQEWKTYESQTVTKSRRKDLYNGP